MKSIRFAWMFATLLSLSILSVSAAAQSNVPKSPFQSDNFGASAGSAAPFIFLPEVNYDSGGYQGHSVAVGDVNGDGKLDLVVANVCASIANCPNGGNNPGKVSVLLGNGDGTFQPAVSYNSGGFVALSVAVEDVNGDAKPDIIVANQCAGSACVNGSGPGGVSVLINKGDGTFEAPVSYSSGGYQASSVVIGDVDGDGKLDLVVANACQGGSSTGCNSTADGVVSVLLGNGNGTFQPPINYDSGGVSPETVAIGDLNGDGHPDLVVANVIDSDFTHGEIGVLLNNGDGTFKPPVIYNSIAYDAHGVAIGDVNGDGKPDLVVANGCQTTPCDQGVTVFLGAGDGTFASPVTYSTGAYSSYSIVIRDFNGDGKPDLAVASWDPHSVGVLMGNGDGTFQAPVIYDTGTNYCCYGANSIAIADVNGDGKPDLLVANTSGDSGSDGSVGVLLNNNGAPQTTTSLVASSNPANVNQSITYTAKVAQSGGTVNGNVAFRDGATTVATLPLSINEAKFTATYGKFQVGAHIITAIYQGALHVAASSEAALTEYVRNATTKTVLTTSGSPSLVGQAVTFTATVTSSFGKVPDGELVTFYTGGKSVASVALASGTASYTTTVLSAASHYIKATYVGDTKFEPSTGSVTQVVNPYASTTKLTSSPNPSTFGQSVKLTATVTSGATGGPTGNVTFKNGATVLGTATLSASKAIFSTTKLPVGTLTLTASYNGDAKSGKSSGTTTQTVH